MKKLTLIDKAFLLKNTPLFGVLDLDLLLPIADKLRISHFEAETPIFEAGEEAHLMYLIVEGTVRIGDHVLSEGDFFGDEALFNERPRAYSAVAEGDTKTVTLSRTNLLTIISECPAVALGFLQVYSTAVPLRPKENPS